MFNKTIIFVLLLLLSSCAGHSFTPTVNTAPIRETEGPFRFQSSIWINLHHYLYEQAFDRKKEIPALSGLEPSEQKTLDAAVAYYYAEFKGRDLLFDDGLTSINRSLSEIGNESVHTSSDLPADLKVHLEATLPIYKKYGWNTQDAQNKKWIASVRIFIRTYGSEIQTRLEKSLQTKLPVDLIDVSGYADWSGAYTRSRPPHTVINSGRESNQDDGALEMLFHEILHTGPLDGVQDIIDAEFKSKGTTDKDSLWHAILFSTAGEITREVLAEGGIHYVPYAIRKGLFAKGSWAKFEPLIHQYWQPYLEGKTDMHSALKNIVDQLTHA